MIFSQDCLMTREIVSSLGRRHARRFVNQSGTGERPADARSIASR